VLYRVLILDHQVGIDRLANGCDSYLLHTFLTIINMIISTSVFAKDLLMVLEDDY
jgi:hypothetical protein